MIKRHHKKIAIVGNAGSGKTTVAIYLQKKFGLPLYHLDQYYWKPNWQRLGLDKFTEIHAELCNKDEWIIEGSYLKLLQERVLHADVVIFLDMPRYVCIWRVIKRSVLNLGKVIPGNPADCKQQVFSFKFATFLKWVWDFNNRYRNGIIATLNSDEFNNNSKIIYIVNDSKFNCRDINLVLD